MQKAGFNLKKADNPEVQSASRIHNKAHNLRLVPYECLGLVYFGRVMLN